MRVITIRIELSDSFVETTPQEDVEAIRCGNLSIDELFELEKIDSDIQIFVESEDREAGNSVGLEQK